MLLLISPPGSRVKYSFTTAAINFFAADTGFNNPGLTSKANEFWQKTPNADFRMRQENPLFATEFKEKQTRQRTRLSFKQAEVQVNSTERHKGIGHV